MTATELAIINFSPDKYVDAATLSRIRSHAQQSVQDQKLLGLLTRSRRPTGKVDEKSSKLVFDKTSGKEVKRALRNRVVAKDGKRKCRSPSQDEGQIVVRATPSPKSSLSSGNGDPFSAFPAKIDAEFVGLFEDYYTHWIWYQPKSVLFQEILSSPVSYYSFLTVGYDIWRHDEVHALVNENKALKYIQEGIRMLHAVPNDLKSGLASSLMWAMIRLAVRSVGQGQLETSWQHLSALLGIVYHEVEDWSATKFAMHIQSCIASLLLANFTKSTKITRLLKSPRDPMNTTAVDDVFAQGFVAPGNALLYDASLERMIQPEVRDAILALTALYNTCDDSDDSPDRIHPNCGRRTLESVKIALRLANINSAGPSLVNTSDSWLFEFQECLRLVSLLFTWGFGRRIATQNESTSMGQQYTRAHLTPQFICRLLDQTTEASGLSDLVLWMLIVCGSTTGWIEDKLYYSGLIRAFFPHTITWTFERAKSVGNRLPWIDTKHRTPVLEFWSMVTGNPLGDDSGMEMIRQEFPRNLYSGFIRSTNLTPIDHTWNVWPVVDLSGVGLVV